MTLLAWVVWLGLKRPATRATSLWAGNLLAALFFAAAHLPGQPPDVLHPEFLIPILMVNAAGTIMGWLFMRYGLISALGAHFVADVVQVAIPRLAAWLG